MKKLRTHLLALAAGVALTAGSASLAFAQAPSFQVTPSVAGGPAGVFTANDIGATTSELLTFNSTGATGSGWVDFTAFANNSVPIGSGITGLGNQYGLYITFTLSDTLTSGTLGKPGSTYTLNSLDFSMFVDTTNNDTFTAANANTATNATVTVNAPADKLVATGSLIVGTAGFDALGGAFLNSTETFNNTAFGNTYFTSPVPFFNLAFDEFNNTQQGVLQNGNLVSINDATGDVDFNKTPEPASLALFGSGVLALGWVARRRRKNVTA